MRKSPEQALYDALFKVAQGICEHVYDFYPRTAPKRDSVFVVLLESTYQPRATKDSLLGRVEMHARVVGSAKNRKAVSDTAETLCIEFANYMKKMGVRLRLSDCYITMEPTQTESANFWEASLSLPVEIL